jgi:phage terminase small subunit
MADEQALTPKEEIFIQQYLIDFNGARAARAAGYSEHTAREIAAENLTKPHIRARIEHIRAGMARAFNITRERIAQEYARIAFFDIRKAFDADGELIPIKDLDEDTALAIAGIEVSNDWDRDEAGKAMIVGQLKKIKISDKRAALDSLCKLMGYNEPDKMLVQGLKFIVTEPDAGS